MISLPAVVVVSHVDVVVIVVNFFPFSPEQLGQLEVGSKYPLEKGIHVYATLFSRGDNSVLTKLD